MTFARGTARRRSREGMIHSHFWMSSTVIIPSYLLNIKVPCTRKLLVCWPALVSFLVIPNRPISIRAQPPNVFPCCPRCSRRFAGGSSLRAQHEFASIPHRVTFSWIMTPWAAMQQRGTGGFHFIPSLYGDTDIPDETTLSQTSQTSQMITKMVWQRENPRDPLSHTHPPSFCSGLLARQANTHPTPYMHTHNTRPKHHDVAGTFGWAIHGHWHLGAEGRRRRGT